MPEVHLHDELARNPARRVSVDTRYGLVLGGRASNKAVIFLGNLTNFSSDIDDVCIMIDTKFNCNDFQKFRMRCLRDDLKTLSLCQMITDMKPRNTFRSLNVSYIHAVLFQVVLTIISCQPVIRCHAAFHRWSITR